MLKNSLDVFVIGVYCTMFGQFRKLTNLNQHEGVYATLSILFSPTVPKTEPNGVMQV